MISIKQKRKIKREKNKYNTAVNEEKNRKIYNTNYQRAFHTRKIWHKIPERVWYNTIYQIAVNTRNIGTVNTRARSARRNI